MLIRNVTRDDLDRAAEAAQVALYDLKTVGRGFRFTLRPIRNGQQPARWQRTSASSFNRGRRVWAVCWHGHYAFFGALTARQPAATIITSMARYNGRDEFLATATRSRECKVGSLISPVAYGDACMCDADLSLYGAAS